jgi:hypothetical protein
MFPVNTGGGVPSLSGTFIPQIWASKLLTKFYLNTVYNEICNTDYEGVIKGHGDEVKIRTRPDIVVSDYVKGAGLNYANPTSPNVQLLIDQGHYFAFNLFDVDKHQSDINLMNEWGNDGSEQMKIKIDNNILGSIYSQAAGENAGANAGKISNDINLGTSGSPLVLTKLNIVDAIVDYGTILDEQNRPEADRYIVLPAKACARIKTSELKDASLSGDGTSTLRNGKIGRIDRFNIYSSNNMNVTTGKYDVIFGHKSATTFAGQITDMESLKNPNDFGDLARSLFVYGFEVIDPNSLGHSVITVG